MKNAETLAAEYPVTLAPIPVEDGGGYYASCDKFPGLLGDGDTLEQAAEDFRHVLTSAIERRLSEGKALPGIDDPFEQYSGKLSLRIARSLHAKTAKYAKMDGISINQWISNAVSMAVAAHETVMSISKFPDQPPIIVEPMQAFEDVPINTDRIAAMSAA
jgi:Uncharacterized protein encoded in hypervariable junctions of pilus gene clusters